MGEFPALQFDFADWLRCLETGAGDSPFAACPLRLALPAFVASFAVLAGSAHANDLCTTVGASTTCSGDQSAGIALNSSGVVTSLFVQSLTVPIAPAAGTSGISFQSQGFNGFQHSIPRGLPGSALSVTTDTSVGISPRAARPESW